MRYEIRQHGVGGILDQAVQLTKNHFGVLFGITCALLVPAQFVQGFLFPVPPENPTPEAMTAYGQEVIESLKFVLPLGFLIGLVVVPITNGAIIRAVADCYLGKSATVGGSLKSAIGRVIPLLGTWFLGGMIVLVGLMMLFIPGIIFFLWYMCATHVVVLEGGAGPDALSRSKQLMKGNMLMACALLILLAAIQMGISFGARFVGGYHLQLVTHIVLSAVATVFSAAAFVVFYFSCRCKAENFDLTLLADAVGAPESADDADEI